MPLLVKGSNGYGACYLNHGGGYPDSLSFLKSRLYSVANLSHVSVHEVSAKIAVGDAINMDIAWP